MKNLFTSSNFRKISLPHIPQLTRTYTHTHALARYLPAREYFYGFLIHYSRCRMKLLSAALVNFHTTNYSCTVTATLHAVRFHAWYLLMFYSMLHFLHPYISVPPAVPQPLFTQSQSTHTSRITNGTTANSHRTALLGSAVPLCTVTLRFNW
jgi:hypothetical protein